MQILTANKTVAQVGDSSNDRQICMRMQMDGLGTIRINLPSAYLDVHSGVAIPRFREYLSK